MSNAYLTTNNETWDSGVFLLYGPPEAGKTFAAATIDPKFPEKVPAIPPVTLDSMLWVSADPGATSGLREAGVVVREIPWSRLVADMGVLKAMGAVPELVKEARKDQTGLRTLVVDTLSAVDSGLRAYFDEYCPTTKGGDRDTIAMNGRIGSYHTRFHNALINTGLRIIYLAHAKSLEAFGPEQDSAKRRKEAAGVSIIEPAISGGALNMYRGAASLTLRVSCIREKGKPDKRLVYTRSSGDWEAKSRFQLSLKDTEDAHLGRIIDKVRQTMAAA